MIRQIKKKCLSLVLALALLFSLATAAFAADAPWAGDAATALNTIYGSGFTADDAAVTVDAMKTLLTTKFGYDPGDALVTGLGGSGDLIRLQLSQVVCKVYGLAENLSAGAFPDCSDPAVITLRSLGIVVGSGDGRFHPEGTVTNAELAVIFYRALGKAGAGGGSALNGIKPGAYGYDEIMYLAARGCVPFNVDPAAQLSSATISVSDGTTLHDRTGKQAIWEAWCARLGSLPPASSRSVVWTAYSTAPETLLDAAVQIVAEDRASLNNDNKGIFSDVNPSSFYYDGVMYLFNKGIVVGHGDGKFFPGDSLKREELAVFICRVKNIDTSSPAGGVIITDIADITGYAVNAVTQAIAGGYMTYTDGTTFSPQASVNRQQAALAVFKSFNGYAAGDVNLSVLVRFSDGAQVGGAYQTAMAYLVSAGIVGGNGAGQLNPTGEIDRATFGVLLARAMMGLDKSKMHDYETAVTGVLS